MVARKLRLPVVLDTNVLVRHFLSKKRQSPNSRVFRIWLVQGQIQLVLSEEVIREYVRLLSEKTEMTARQVQRWDARFRHDAHCTVVAPGPRPKLSRDPDDNIFLATALAGKAEYLITNDRDLLELREEFRAAQPFAVVTPTRFLAEIEKD